MDESSGAYQGKRWQSRSGSGTVERPPRRRMGLTPAGAGGVREAERPLHDLP
jgi:hypothetical protein